MQNHTKIQDGMLCDTLPPKALQTSNTREGDIPPHIEKQTNTFVSDTNNTTKDKNFHS